MRRYLAVLVGIVVLAAVGVILGIPGRSVPHASADTGAPITFSTPTVVDPIHAFGEPTISFNSPTGEVYASGPTGTGTQRSQWEGSFDGGQTFRQITPNAPPTAFQSTEDPPGGGDTDLNFDHTGKEYFLDLYALACVRSATTSDGGATVNQSPDACGQTAGADRQWLAVYDPPAGTPHGASCTSSDQCSMYTGKTPLIYDEFNNLNGPGPNSGAQWNRSPDGITTWTDATNASSQSPSPPVTPATEAIYSPFGPDGYPAIDQQTGKVFQAAALPEGYGGTTNGKFDLDLNIGTPDANGNLTFLDAPPTPGEGPGGAAPGSVDYSKLIKINKDPLTGSPDTLFSVLSMDSARNLYVVYDVLSSKPSEDQAWVSASSAASGWKNWTPPVQVSDGSTSTGDAVNVFPWIKAGGPGRADAVWYGADKSVDPSSQSGQAWNVFMNQLVFPTDSSGAITGAAPTTTLVKVSPHPMHYNDVCLLGSDCITAQGNRNLADFFSVTIDSSGAAEVIYDDTSNGLAQQGFTPSGNQTVDHAGAALVTIARQSSGMGLFGQPVSGTSNAPSPTGGMTDPSGDAKYPVIGGSNVPGMDLLGTTLSLSPDEKTLTVTNKVVDLSNPSATAAAIQGTQLLQYVTRWQMGNTLYYAGMSTSASGQPSFYAGKTQSVDLCSVSACDPHVLTYPESGSGGSAEKGAVTCPSKPSADDPCTITINVAAGDVGSPSDASMLEETGTYALATSHPQGTTTNAQAQADNVPLEIDGTCCFNFQARAVSAASVSNPVGGSGGERFGHGGGTFSHGGPKCPPASGRLSGKRLGPFSLGITRSHARHTLHRFVVTRYGFDDFCLRHGWGIRVGYASPRLVRTLPKRLRGAVGGRAVEILTANRFYALNGVRPGTRLTTRLLLRLHALKYYAIGMNDWYLVPGRTSDGVLKVRYHTVLEIGVADKRAAFGHKGPARFFNSFRRG